MSDDPAKPQTDASAAAASRTQSQFGTGSVQFGDHTQVAGDVFTGDKIVNLYQHARPQPVDAAALAQAGALLAALPLKDIPPPAALPPGSTPPPYPPYALFVGREAEFRRLARALMGSGAAGIAPTAAITGLGGLGKTQLAAEFAHRYGRFFPGGVFWLNCAQPADVLGQVAQCGGAGGLNLRPDFDALTLDQQAGLVLAEWQNGVPRLLIFDNCESAKLLASLRPRTGACRVLVTSRNAAWEAALGVQTLALEVLTRAQSVALLRRFRPDLAGPEAGRALGELADELGDLPLALHLAGSFLERYRYEVTPAQLLAELRDEGVLRHAALAGERAGYSPTGHDWHVARTFAVSYKDLQGDEAVDALARRALARAACFAPGQPIPRALLKQTLGEVQPPRLAEDALRRLAELGLLATAGDNAVTLHRLLARFVQQAAPDEGAFEAVAETLAEEAYRINQAGLPAPLRGWVGHLRHVAEQAEAGGEAIAGRLFNSLGYHLNMEADYAGARAAYERALKIDEAAFGPDHPEVATDVNNLGSVLQDLGDYAGARAAYERALKIDEAALGPDHPEVAIRINNLGGVLQALGDHAGARAAFERALQIDEAAFGPDHPNVAIRVNNLGGVLDSLGDYAGARAAYERALQIDEAAFGRDHPEVARDVNNLGSVLQDLGDHTGARAAYERALKIDEAAFGPDHPKIAIRVNNLGSVLRALGDHAGARAAYERALKIDEAAFGRDHPNVAIRINNLGSVLHALGDHAGARAAFERALKIDEAAFGPDHPKVAIDVNNLGLVLRAVGDYAGARAAYERALRIFDRELGPDHPNVATLVNNLGEVLRAVGDYAGARAAYERALRIDEAAFGPDHPNVAIRVNNLGGVLQDLGDHAGARAAYERALRICEATLGPEHPNSRIVRSNLDRLPPPDVETSG